ncbi:SREBP regulating gene protein isoform X3 [Lepus europaeus]|uniref:SREBP regulating gene protein isoform X3 n=1 Tax=Lepus europaeus TaxID=9983 RepID=UPI002B45B9A6|nr:SREBP regulating gene protein isoform X3 [Lepus europaeus]
MPPALRACHASRPGRRALRPRRDGEPGGHGVAPASAEEEERAVRDRSLLQVQDHDQPIPWKVQFNLGNSSRPSNQCRNSIQGKHLITDELVPLNPAHTRPPVSVSGGASGVLEPKPLQMTSGPCICGRDVVVPPALSLPRRCISREVDQKWSSWDLNWCSDVGCWHDAGPQNLSYEARKLGRVF